VPPIWEVFIELSAVLGWRRAGSDEKRDVNLDTSIFGSRSTAPAASVRAARA